jgi:hypothetical protein
LGHKQARGGHQHAGQDGPHGNLALDIPDEPFNGFDRHAHADDGGAVGDPPRDEEIGHIHRGAWAN